MFIPQHIAVHRCKVKRVVLKFFSAGETADLHALPFRLRHIIREIQSAEDHIRKIIVGINIYLSVQHADYEALCGILFQHSADLAPVHWQYEHAVRVPIQPIYILDRYLSGAHDIIAVGVRVSDGQVYIHMIKNCAVPDSNGHSPASGIEITPGVKLFLPVPFRHALAPDFDHRRCDQVDAVRLSCKIFLTFIPVARRGAYGLVNGGLRYFGIGGDQGFQLFIRFIIARVEVDRVKKLPGQFAVFVLRKAKDRTGQLLPAAVDDRQVLIFAVAEKSVGIGGDMIVAEDQEVDPLRFFRQPHPLVVGIDAEFDLSVRASQPAVIRNNDEFTAFLPHLGKEQVRFI